MMGRVFLYLLGVFVMILSLPVLPLVAWHNSTFAYICPQCGKKFSITFLENLLSPHLFRVKYVKCPDCQIHRWSQVVRK